MDSEVKFLLNNAEHEILLANALKKLSEKAETKEMLGVPEATTFYNSVIGHSYYAIFYSAKAYLISKEVKIPEQGQHQAVYFGFKRMVKQGEIEKELLKMYEDVRLKAEALLDIFEKEGEKRAAYTYKLFPHANKKSAEESTENAQFFVSHMKKFIEADETAGKVVER